MSRALGLALGFAADRALGDPARWHPVAGFGRLAAAADHAWYADSRPRGVLHAAALTGSTTALGVVLDRASRRRPPAHTAVVAACTWAVLGGRTLEREAGRVQAFLDVDDLPAARRQVTHLVGRDPSVLDADGVARATVESVAENTSDAVVAPLLLGGLAGPAGLLGYRAANTLDAMVGHRTPRLERFGWASARLDDVLNLVPARVAALLAAASAPLVGGSPAEALRAWRRDASAHPSPNAGPVEAGFAGALGLRLGGTTVYPGRTEERPVLGRGRPPTPADVPRATRLALAVDVGALGVALLLARLTGRGSRRTP